MSFRHGGLASKSNEEEVALMNDYEVINVVIGIIGLVLTAVAVGITIGKKNRH